MMYRLQERWALAQPLLSQAYDAGVIVPARGTLFPRRQDSNSIAAKRLRWPAGQ